MNRGCGVQSLINKCLDCFINFISYRRVVTINLFFCIETLATCIKNHRSK